MNIQMPIFRKKQNKTKDTVKPEINVEMDVEDSSSQFLPDAESCVRCKTSNIRAVLIL